MGYRPRIARTYLNKLNRAAVQQAAEEWLAELGLPTPEKLTPIEAVEINIWAGNLDELEWANRGMRAQGLGDWDGLGPVPRWSTIALKTPAELREEHKRFKELALQKHQEFLDAPKPEPTISLRVDDIERLISTAVNDPKYLERDVRELVRRYWEGYSTLTQHRIRMSLKVGVRIDPPRYREVEEAKEWERLYEFVTREVPSSIPIQGAHEQVENAWAQAAAWLASGSEIEEADELVWWIHPRDRQALFLEHTTPYLHGLLVVRVADPTIEGQGPQLRVVPR